MVADGIKKRLVTVIIQCNAAVLCMRAISCHNNTRAHYKLALLNDALKLLQDLTLHYAMTSCQFCENKNTLIN